MWFGGDGHKHSSHSNYLPAAICLQGEEGQASFWETKDTSGEGRNAQEGKNREPVIWGLDIQLR